MPLVVATEDVDLRNLVLGSKGLRELMNYEVRIERSQAARFDGFRCYQTVDCHLDGVVGYEYLGGLEEGVEHWDGVPVTSCSAS